MGCINKEELGFAENRSPDNYGRWLPLVTGLFIAGAYVVSLIDNGYFSWPFNSIVYLKRYSGAGITIVCLLALFLATKYRVRLCAWTPSRWIQSLLLVRVMIIFIGAIILASIWAPMLEGDGNLLCEDVPFRLRNILAGTTMN